MKGKVTVQWNLCLTRVTKQFARPSCCKVVAKVMDVFVLTPEDLPAAGYEQFRNIFLKESTSIFATKKDMLTSVDVDFPYAVIAVDGFGTAL